MHTCAFAAEFGFFIYFFSLFYYEYGGVVLVNKRRLNSDQVKIIANLI